MTDGKSTPVTQAYTVTVTGANDPATQLMITMQPVGGASGTALTVQPVVKICDAYGNTVTADNSTVVGVSILSGSGGTLGGTLTSTVSGGVGAFSGVTLAGLVGQNYVLQFTSIPALTSVNSSAVTVTAGAPSQCWYPR